MLKIHTARYRYSLLTLTISSVIGIMGLGIGLIKHDPKPPFPILESKTMVLGAPVSGLSHRELDHFFFLGLERQNHPEQVVINQTFIQKGFIAQTYQQTPYALALVALQLKARVSREKTLNAAIALTPRNHPLQTIVTQLKLR